MHSCSQGRLPGREPVAIIDIGSNSIRLVIYEGIARSPTVLFNEKMLAGLGRGMHSTGHLDPEAVDMAIAELQRFRTLCRQAGARELHVIATAAARDAENGPEFIRRAEGILETPISVLTGQQEAHHAALGIISSFLPADGIAGDLGGGSLELVDICGDRIGESASLPLGGLRLQDRSGNDPETAARIADAEVASWIHLAAGRNRAFYAIGGTWRNLARLHMIQTRYPLNVMHHYVMEPKRVRPFLRAVVQGKIDADGIAGISKKRRALLPYGAGVLLAVMKHMRPAQIVISAFGVREGFLHDLLPLDQKTQDPLLAAAGELALLRSRSVRHAHELAACAGKAFAAFGIDETPDEMRYRQAACLLADIGWRAHPDYRGTQSLNIISHASFVGVDHPGRCYLALAAAFRHEGLNASVAKELQELTPPRLLHRARILAGLMRVFYLLSASMPGILPRLQWVPTEDDALQLLLPRDMGGLHGERPRGRLDQLARLVGRKLDLVVEPEPVH